MSDSPEGSSHPSAGHPDKRVSPAPVANPDDVPAPLKLGAHGSDDPAATAEGQGGELSNALERLQSFRKWVGGVACVLAVGIVAVVLRGASHTTPTLAGLKEAEGIDLWLFLISMSLHAVISVAAVWFAYQLLRFGERMFLPLGYLPHAKSLLGVDGPAEAAPKAVRALFKEFSEMCAPIIKAVNSGKD